ncbi:MAG: glycosyltransferase family 2 protein [Candidatus Theseobacter exili]|nr:glycosyltransferase family 2 protein [Candidatus Theseobacter exili]
MKIKKLSVLIPVYNERATIEEIIRRVRLVNLDNEKEIIVIDDSSTDGTRDILEKMVKEDASLIVLFHEKNRGKGAAIKTGIVQITGDYTVIQDADLEYDPEDYHKLIAPVQKDKAVVVYGSRFTGEHRNMFFWHLLGNRFLSLMTNILYNTTISDMETCYKLFQSDIIKSINIKSNRFDFEPEITAKILKDGVRIYEVPVSYAGREFSEGKKITWKDGFAACWALIRYRFCD